MYIIGLKSVKSGLSQDDITQVNISSDKNEYVLLGSLIRKLRDIKFLNLILIEICHPPIEFPHGICKNSWFWVC